MPVLRRALVCALLLLAARGGAPVRVGLVPPPAPAPPRPPSPAAWSPGLTDPLVWHLTAARLEWWYGVEAQKPVRHAVRPPAASRNSRQGTTPLKPHTATQGSTSWDRIAACESGGDWSANTGNGFEGGLQFSPSTWRAYGGTGHAYNASRDEQIAVAERVLAGQGIGAWPVCGRRG